MQHARTSLILLITCPLFTACEGSGSDDDDPLEQGILRYDEDVFQRFGEDPESPFYFELVAESDWGEDDAEDQDEPLIPEVIAPANIPDCTVEGVTPVVFTVLDVLDLPDADLTDGLCESASGTCTLRAAIQQANATAAGFTHIAVAPGDYELLIPAGGLADASCLDATCMLQDESDAAVGDLDVHVPLCITGRSRDDVVIRSSAVGDVGRVFEIHPDAASSVFSGVVMRNLTIAESYAPAYVGVNPISSMVSMVGCQSGEDECAGGAIRNQGVLFAHQLLVRDNASNSNGNAVINSGEMVLSNSLVESNIDMLGHGGGVLNTGMLTVQHSTFDDNETDLGGAISNMAGVVDIVNSTFHDNRSPWEGAAISNSSDGQVSVLSSTIALSGAPHTGAAIYAQSGQVLLRNSIVADTVGENCREDGGTIAAMGDNLTTDMSCTGFSLVAAADLQPLSTASCPPMSSSLQVCTPTMEPASTSMAIDGATSCTDWVGNVMDLDQQGEVRSPSVCELGADEV